MIKTPFKQTESEVVCSAAATLCLTRLAKLGVSARRLGDVAEVPQYGYTAAAEAGPTATRFLRITDIRGGAVEWTSVPFCECPNPIPYLLHGGDLLVARSGSVGKSFLVGSTPEPTIFASYMIRIRAKLGLLPEFAFWCFQSQQFWEQLLIQRRGSAMTNVNGTMLSGLSFQIPDEGMQASIARFLTSLQQRLQGTVVELGALPASFAAVSDAVVQIEKLADQIRQARNLRIQATEAVQTLCRSILTHDTEAVPTELKDLVLLRPPDVTVQRDENYQFAGVYSFGRGVFRGTSKSGLEFSYPRLTRLRAGNFVYPKLMAWEGALGIVPMDCDGCVVSTEFPVFEVREERVLPEVLDTYFRTPSVWPGLSGASTGTNVRRRRLNPKDFLAYKMPLPSRATQERLRMVKKLLTPVEPMQSEIATELDALLPAVLDRAFRANSA